MKPCLVFDLLKKRCWIFPIFFLFALLLWLCCFRIQERDEKGAAAQVNLTGVYYSEDLMAMPEEFCTGTLITLDPAQKSMHLTEGYVYLVTFSVTSLIGKEHMIILIPEVNEEPLYLYENVVQTALDGSITNSGSFMIQADQPMSLQMRFTTDDMTRTQAIGTLSVSAQAKLE